MESFDDTSESSSFSTKRRPHYQVLCKKRPRNTLDILALESEMYQKYKLTEREIKMISQFKLDQKIIDEIIKLCYLYKNKIKRRDLFPVVLYKIIKRYNCPISIRDIERKINFKRARYLKCMNVIQFYENSPSFGESVLTSSCYILTKLLELVRNNKQILTVNANGNTIRKVIMNIDLQNSNKIFFDNNEFIKERIKEIRCKIEKIIKEKDLVIDFDSFFEDHIHKDVLAICLIQWLLSLSDIILSKLNTEMIFEISASRILRGMTLLNEYIRINKIIIN